MSPKGEGRSDIRGNRQKIKILKLIELIKQETDEARHISTNEICSRLGTMGLSCERHCTTERPRIRIDVVRVGKEKARYIEDKKFLLMPFKQPILLQTKRAPADR